MCSLRKPALALAFAHDLHEDAQQPAVFADEPAGLATVTSTPSTASPCPAGTTAPRPQYRYWMLAVVSMTTTNSPEVWTVT